MKTFLKIALCLLLAAGFAACDKNETPVIGRLEVEYKGAKANLVSIDTEAGNEIYSQLNPRSKFSIDLNPGNYAIFSGDSIIAVANIFRFRPDARHTLPMTIPEIQL